MFFIKESPQSPRIFESDFLDACSRTHWVVVPLLFGPAIAFLLWYSVASKGVGLLSTLGLVLVGWFCWTFVEYVLHRTLFHWVPEAPWGKRMHFLMHGVHHEMPRDKYRLVMPPLVSITLFFLFLGVWLLLLGRYAWAFHGGFVFGYMIYDMIHYHVHHRRAGFRWLRRLKKHHFSHHFAEDYAERRFGVSTRFWDVVFRTDAIEDEASESASPGYVSNLGRKKAESSRS